MKKLLIIIFSLILCFTAIGCSNGNGCSCSPEDPVSYYLNWTGNNLPTYGYKETATYTVTYSANFNENNYNYKKVENIGCDITLSDSIYTVTTEIVTKDAIPENAKSYVDSSFTGKFYKIKTDLSINPTYTISGKTLSFNDKVTSEVYFYDETFGFSPIYSVKNYDTTNVSLNTEGYAEKIVRYVYNTETFYDGGNITFKITQNSELPADGDKISVPKINTYNGFETEGDFKKFIDNETLLFACRNISLKNGDNLKVASPSYLNVEDISVSNVTNSTTYVTIAVNGESSGDQIPTARLAVLRSAENNTGSPILLDIQRDTITVGGTEYNNAFMVKMITRLPSHVGALIYTLNSVEITAQ